VHSNIFTELLLNPMIDGIDFPTKSIDSQQFGFCLQFVRLCAGLRITRDRRFHFWQFAMNLGMNRLALHCFG
jgi:hypothetical protein